jgi:hypothetical protein
MHCCLRLARAAVLEPGNERLRRAIAADRRRDRRQLGPLLVAWRQLLLHRAQPARYPLTAATREWQEDRLIDLVRKYMELTGHEDPFALRAQDLAPLALRRGLHGWVRIRALTTSDFPGLLDGVAHTLFVEAYADTVRSFTAWTTPVTVTDFRSTIASVATFPDLLAIPEHGEYIAGSPFGTGLESAANISSRGCQSWLRLVAVRGVQLHGGLDESLQGLLVYLVALVEVDGTPRIALEARVEEARGVLQGGALGEGHLHVVLVRFTGADHPVVIPDRDSSPLPFLDHFGVGLLDQGADSGEHLTAPVAQLFDPRVDEPRRRVTLALVALLLHGLSPHFPTG